MRVFHTRLLRVVLRLETSTSNGGFAAKCLSTTPAKGTCLVIRCLPAIHPITSQRYFTTKKVKGKKLENKNKPLEDEDSDYTDDDEHYEDFVEIPFDAPPEDIEYSHFSKSNDKNAALQSVIDSGLDHLKAASTMIQHAKEAKKPLFHKGDREEDTGPTKQQLAEANRILAAANQCLAEMEHKKRHVQSPLQIGGYSILLLHAEVNSNLREATIYWALPFEILMEVDEDQEARKQLTERMQYRIEKEGGGSFLQRHVHRILAHYYPPKLRFKPAPDGLLREMHMI